MLIDEMEKRGIFEMGEDELLALPIEDLRGAYNCYDDIANMRAEEEGVDNPFDLSLETVANLTVEELVDIIIGVRIEFNIY